jgi:hypothetical protein
VLRCPLCESFAYIFQEWSLGRHCILTLKNPCLGYSPPRSPSSGSPQIDRKLCWHYTSSLTRKILCRAFTTTCMACLFVLDTLFCMQVILSMEKSRVSQISQSAFVGYAMLYSVQEHHSAASRNCAWLIDLMIRTPLIHIILLQPHGCTTQSSAFNFKAFDTMRDYETLFSLSSTSPPITLPFPFPKTHTCRLLFHLSSTHLLFPIYIWFPWNTAHRSSLLVLGSLSHFASTHLPEATLTQASKVDR